MKRTLKLIGKIVAGLVGLLVLAFAALYIIGTVKWNGIRGKDYEVSVEKISIPTDQASIARGKHIVAIRMCQDCHGEDLSGQSDSVPGLVTFAFPNLTPGVGGVGATDTDDDWVRAIRYGVGRDGRGLILMPSRIWYYLSDDDLADLIAYLKTLPPVDNKLPKTELGPLGRVMMTLGQLPPEATTPDVLVIDHDGPRPVAPQPGVTLEYGKYLTPGGELHFWSEEDFMKTLRRGVTPGGRQLKTAMPWKYFGQMTDDELKAVWLYLQSLPAMEQGK